MCTCDLVLHLCHFNKDPPSIDNPFRALLEHEKADLTIWLDVTPETADARTNRGSGDGRDEMEKAASQTRASIIRGYADQCDASWRRIDGEGTPEETETLVWREVEPMTNK